jgi:hypothetical protein
VTPARRPRAETGELAPADPLAVDLHLAAQGHDLYEDTGVAPEEVRERFGARVDSFIRGMTNEQGDHDRAAYVAHMTAAPDWTIECTARARYEDSVEAIREYAEPRKRTRKIGPTRAMADRRPTGRSSSIYATGVFRTLRRAARASSAGP